MGILQNANEIFGFELFLLLGAAFVAYLVGFPQVLSGMFVSIILSSLVMPQKFVPPLLTFLLLGCLAAWLLLQILPEWNFPHNPFFQDPNVFILGVLALPALVALGWLAPTLHHHVPHVLKGLGMLIPVSILAYVLPYLVAVKVEYISPFAGIGCLDIGCGISTTEPKFHLYTLAERPAGTISMLLVLSVGLSVKLLLLRVRQTQTAEPSDV
jgi:hypothetical protein